MPKAGHGPQLPLPLFAPTLLGARGAPCLADRLLRRLNALEPTLAPVRINGSWAQPPADAAVARAHHAIQSDRLVLPHHQLAVALIDEPLNPLTHAIHSAAVGHHFAIEP